ncbi:MAG: hypothetical protein EBZ53_03770 [Verrucomicrobia bacterium]|nr:hypothetical protein [Verrucomicrobiota bacterium]NDA25783.1 hypothetical protein [Verrucomicrobiota bacterium]NDD81675.1 hypothetical protein [Verrucomicrobiota bacterium]
MANPNIVSVTSIYGKTAALALTTSETSIVTNSSSSNKIFKINSLTVTNYQGTNAYDVNCRFYDSGTATSFFLASTISVPADASLVLISKDTSIYLEEGDSLTLWASSNATLQAVISYEEIA